ncbi:hypothetical protein L226DRAFT_532393 [Lentinus tigrinus ALCF2SS1-7]|uniref:Secreted protein n=1 Tax=Lentinus tigrinus ALCF2SS1-6 TaxID=1328759 RepID=A0A5C2SFQ8_9APHY|nr:hypothetical protein L227DRAFT_573160 [Lentinus tigrinus ALCF2SS1-6]RPD77619.1 hypothetical protein L226DRAFT_532393 [Lentinus tigrinus ALCF2SS1-7]
MLFAAVQIVLGLLSLFLSGVLAAPPTSTSGSSDDQVVLGGTFKKDREYENGELPPTKHTLGWIDPRLKGGRLIDYTSDDLGEPLNIIISAESDPYILTEQGMQTYVKSIGFNRECLGLHYGHIHEADLGDGLGRKEEQFLGRQHYFPIMGTCWESVRGGHHFRAWRQNGTDANSGAWFIGASEEMDSSKNHMIVEDGYNRGRNYIVDRATEGSHWKGMWWKANVEWREGLLERGKRGVNHGIEQDGRVAILTIYRL